MQQTVKISDGANYSAVSIGPLDALNEHIFRIAPGVEIPGKVFLGDALQCSGIEVSFQSLPPQTGITFLHTHKTNEELYLVIRGDGEYQVDGTVFPISEGSAIRVSPSGRRSWRNTGNEPLVMICIQAMAGSLPAPGASDGVLLNAPVVW